VWKFGAPIHEPAVLYTNGMTHPIRSSLPLGLDAVTPTVETILRRIERCVRHVSLGFERWDEPAVRGPGLYFVVERASTAAFVAPMGANRWPVEDCATVFAGFDTFRETARGVAPSRDGAVVVHGDGTIREEMVRVDQVFPAESGRDEDLPYAGWMGARHMSALETSTRPEVIAAITLSEEDGRVTAFSDGGYEEVLAGFLATE
jgi:diadenylate cyclase